MVSGVLLKLCSGCFVIFLFCFFFILKFFIKMLMPITLQNIAPKTIFTFIIWMENWIQIPGLNTKIIIQYIIWKYFSCFLSIFIMNSSLLLIYFMMDALLCSFDPLSMLMFLSCFYCPLELRAHYIMTN